MYPLFKASELVPNCWCFASLVPPSPTARPHLLAAMCINPFADRFAVWEQPENKQHPHRFSFVALRTVVSAHRRVERNHAKRVLWSLARAIRENLVRCFGEVSAVFMELMGCFNKCILAKVKQWKQKIPENFGHIACQKGLYSPVSRTQVSTDSHHRFFWVQRWLEKPGQWACLYTWRSWRCLIAVPSHQGPPILDPMSNLVHRICFFESFLRVWTTLGWKWNHEFQ